MSRISPTRSGLIVVGDITPVLPPCGIATPPVTSPEAKRLAKIAASAEKMKDEGAERKPKELSKEIQQQLQAIEKGQLAFPDGSLGDTSNTVFASMALSRARQFLLPVENRVGLTEIRLLKTQEPDMGWSYLPTQMSEVSLALDGKQNQLPPEKPKEPVDYDF